MVRRAGVAGVENGYIAPVKKRSFSQGEGEDSDGTLSSLPIQRGEIMGMLYQRGKTWWVKYYHNGKPIRESARTEKKMVAKRLLDKREGEVADGKTPGFYFDKVTYEMLSVDLQTDYEINGKKSTAWLERRLKLHLDPFFSGTRVPQITTDKIKAYIKNRIDQGASNASINRELSALKRMLNLGARQHPPKVDRVPHIPMLKENNTRKGFFEHDQFVAVRDALPSYLKGFITFAYKTGWRFSEITGLTWSQVDRKQGIVRLEAGTTKNDDARTVYLDSELKDVIAAQWEKRKTSEKLIPYVFTNRHGTSLIKDIRTAWDSAFEKAGIKKMLPHDLRRTAIRDMVRAGVPERVAMMISGHKTRSVFDRYNIVSDKDLKLAAQQRENYQAVLTGTDSGTISKIPSKKGSRR